MGAHILIGFFLVMMGGSEQALTVSTRFDSKATCEAAAARMTKDAKDTAMSAFAEVGHNQTKPMFYCFPA